jgi:hypothetical protein
VYAVPFTRELALPDTVSIIKGVAVVPDARFSHVAPLSVEYWYMLIVPPLGLAAVNATESRPSRDVMEEMVGAVGTPGTNPDELPAGMGMLAATAMRDAMEISPMTGSSHLACFLAKRRGFRSLKKLVIGVIMLLPY